MKHSSGLGGDSPYLRALAFVGEKCGEGMREPEIYPYVVSWFFLRPKDGKGILEMMEEVKGYFPEGTEWSIRVKYETFTVETEMDEMPYRLHCNLSSVAELVEPSTWRVTVR